MSKKEEQERLGIVQEIANVVIAQTKELKEQSIERNKIRSLARETVKLAEEQLFFDKDSVATQEGLDAVLKKQAQTQEALKRIKAQKNTLDVKDKKLKAELLKNLKEQRKELKKINQNYQEQVELGEKVQKNFGVKVMDSLEDIATKIPGLRKFSGPFKEASQSARKQALHLAKGGKGMGALAKGAGTLLKRMGPLALLGAVTSFFKMLVASDKAIEDLARSTNISYGESQKLRQEFLGIQQTSNSLFINMERVGKAFQDISTTLGTGGNVIGKSKELLATFADIQGRTGMTSDQLMGIADLALTTSGNLEGVTKEFLAQAKLTSINNGVLLNTKTLMADISNVSAATTLSLGKNPPAIARAVAEAKSLGFELNRIESIQSSLLDFESSIAAELEAEVLLGKDLNLNKAREAALNNDLGTLAREISREAGSSAEFTKMNFIQQEAIAKAVGMNREELAKTLFVQEKIANFSGDAAEENKKLLNDRIKAVGLEQAMAEFKEGEFKTLKEQAGISTTLNELMQNLQKLIAGNAEKILGLAESLISSIDTVGNFITKSSGFFNMFAGSVSFNPALVAKGRAQIAIAESENINDGVITPTNGLVVSSGAGSINLASNDSIVGNKNGIIAGTNLFDISPLVTEMQQMRAIMAQILSKDTNVYLDADKVGTSFNINTVSIQ